MAYGASFKNEHSIANLSDARDLVTVMWANEAFDPENPDTYYEEV